MPLHLAELKKHTEQNEKIIQQNERIIALLESKKAGEPVVRNKEISGVKRQYTKRGSGVHK
jgi:hypothetical protein